MFKHNDDLMRWYVGSRKAYNGLKPHQIDQNGCYFLVDTKEILLEGNVYTDLFLTYTGERPEYVTDQKFYLSLDSFEMQLFDGYKWHTVFGLPDTNIITTDPNTQNTIRAVSGEVTANYARRMINNAVLDYAELIKLEYDKKRNQLNFRIGTFNPEETIHITRIGNSIIFDKEKGLIHLLDSTNTVLSSIHIYPEHIISGTFDLPRGLLIFKFASGQVLNIPAVKIMNILNVESTNTMFLETDATRKIEMNVRKSRRRDNMLQIKSDGLYFSYSHLMDKISPRGSNRIVFADANGNAKETMFFISDRDIGKYTYDEYRVVDEDKVSRGLEKADNKLAQDAMKKEVVYDIDEGSIEQSKELYAKAMAGLYMKTVN